MFTRVKNSLKWLVHRKTLILHPHFTRQLVLRYCRGCGCEIGPGINPQVPPARAWHVDRFRRYGEVRIAVDLMADAVALPFADATQDFLFSSHVLEHCPDTLAVLEEWGRVLRPGGVLMLRLPHRDRSFDRARPLTTLAHHIEDRARGDARDDASHHEEFIRLATDIFDHHWKPDARLPDGSYDIDYIVHHGHLHYHVWTQNEMVDLLRHLGFGIRLVVDQCLDRADSFLIVAEKPRD